MDDHWARNEWINDPLAQPNVVVHDSLYLAARDKVVRRDAERQKVVVRPCRQERGQGETQRNERGHEQMKNLQMKKIELIIEQHGAHSFQ